MKILVIYLALVNIAGFGLMMCDKSRASRGSWRVPEARLFLTALMGGSLGILAGMYLFHHKTRHSRFRLGMPVLFAIQLGVVVLMISGR